MSEEDFFDMLEISLCSDYAEYLQVDVNVCCIPFITTLNYLTHPASRKLLKIIDKTVNLQN